MEKKKTSAEAPDATDKHFGERLVHFRKLAHVSQTYVGNAIGVTFQQIQKYENGINRISASRLLQIAKALRVSVSEFYAGLESSSAPLLGFAENGQEPLENTPMAGLMPGQNDDEIRRDRETQDLARAYNRIRDAKQRSTIYALVCAMAEQGKE